MHQNRPFSHSAPPVTIETLPTQSLDHKSMSFDAYHGQTGEYGGERRWRWEGERNRGKRERSFSREVFPSERVVQMHCKHEWRLPDQKLGRDSRHLVRSSSFSRSLVRSFARSLVRSVEITRELPRPHIYPPNHQTNPTPTAPKGRGGAGGARGAGGVVLQQRGGSSMKYKPKTQGSMKESMALQFQAAVARQQRGQQQQQQQQQQRTQRAAFPAPPARNHGKTAPEPVHPSVLASATKSASLGGAEMQAKVSKPIVLATHSLSGKNPNELSFESGERITVLRKEANGWWYGKVVGSAVERAGWFPSTFVKTMSGRTFS